jgi:hypothetical protein
MPYTGTELSQWELGRRNAKQQQIDAVLRMALSRMQQRSQEKMQQDRNQIDQQQLAAQRGQQRIQNDLAERDFKSSDTYRRGIIADRSEVAPQKAPVVPAVLQEAQALVDSGVADSLGSAVMMLRKGAGWRASAAQKGSGSSARRELEADRMSGKVPFKTEKWPVKDAKMFPGPTNSRPTKVTLDIGGKLVRGYKMPNGIFIDEQGNKYQEETPAKK